MDDNLSNIESVFGKVSREEASYEVFATEKQYPRLIKVFIPNNPYRKNIPFMEEREETAELRDVDNWSSKMEENTFGDKEDNLARSLRKTKTLISDYILCNDFELFATFTFSPKKTKDRNDPDALKKQMSNWLHNQRNRNGKFKYLIVPEFHKDKKALHFHALMAGYAGELVPSGKKIKGREAFNFKSYTLGINSAVKMDNPEKVANYVKKYITKDMPQFHDQHRFWASKGLKKPVVIDNPTKWYLNTKPLRIYENDYGLLLSFERGEERDEEVTVS